MRSRHWRNGALLLGLMAGCGDPGTAPGLDGRSVVGARGGSSIQGRVFTLEFAPDSAYAPVARARVSLYFVDTIPSDTTGTPPDTMPVPLMQLMAMLDSIPSDTLRPDPPLPPPTDTLPTDTIPPDANPPPPPVGCGRTGDLIGVAETSREGLFRFRGLRAGKYDLVVQADSGRGLGLAYYCGVHLLPEQRVEVRIFVPTMVRLESGAR